MNRSINIVCSADNKYFNYCAAMLCSLLVNSTNPANIAIYILSYRGITEYNKQLLIKLAQRFGASIRFEKFSAV